MGGYKGKGPPKGGPYVYQEKGRLKAAPTCTKGPLEAALRGHYDARC